MDSNLCTIHTICKPSEEIVAREIEGELIIVPLTAGVGSLEDELYTLNETGRAMWDRLDGKKSLGEVAAELASEFEGPPEKIEKDVLGLAEELLKRQILAKAS